MRQVSVLLAVVGVAVTAGLASADITYRHTITAFAEDADGNMIQVGLPYTWDWSRPSDQNPFQTHGDGVGNWEDWDTDGNGIPQNQEPAASPVHVFGPELAIDGLGFAARANPVVGLNFNVTAGSTNSTFIIDSVVVGGLGGFNGWSGRATSAVTLTRPGTGSGSGNPAGLQTGGNLYSAFFNGNTVASEFSNLLLASEFAGMATGETRTRSASTASFPNFLPLPGDPGLNDVRSQFEFSVPARYRAGGTSSYELVPSPAGAGLLALGGLFAARRRRA